MSAKKDELARKKAEWEKAQRDLEPLKVRLTGSTLDHQYGERNQHGCALGNFLLLPTLR